MPTFSEVVNEKLPDGIDGISFSPTLMGDKNQNEHEFLYWEFPSYGGQQAVRMGKWKGIRKNIFKGNMTIELYDLQVDLSERNDVSSQYPEIITKIESIMKKEHTPAEINKFKMKQLGD